MVSTELQALRQKRLNWVTSNRENGFDEGINRLLTELYPDNAHFIYELLQNAEDPQATAVQFKLTSSAVEFSHNGRRLFTFKDVESITSIGNSTKRDDATSIGKFGVGFKAVFAYTNTPEIHSGDFHFRICDLVVPEPETVKEAKTDLGQTRFLFPFDNPKKPAATAMQEIAKGLRSLGDNTLLFLSHIRKIDYTLPDGSTGSLERREHDNGRIEIRTNRPYSEATVSHWLHFHKNVDVADDDGKTKTCRVAIAYSLVEESNKKTEEKTWKIVPLSHGQVSIYFPAEKETSNLRFHLHAPFASTVARDSVRDCPANEQLRDHIAELIVESLTTIRDQNLLTINFLAVLPNRADNLAELYEPIRASVVEAFKNESLTPTRNGSHGPATGLYRGPVRIANVLSDDDLSFLTNYSPPLWAANPPPQSQREENFLDSLEIDSWGWSELVDVINSAADDERERIEAWISNKDDAWLMRFYALLGEANEEHSEYVHANAIKIVRVITDKGIAHVVPSEAFFPPEDETSAPNDILFVKPDTYKIGKSSAQQELARLFLEASGVRSFDVRTSIKLKLERYENPPEQIEAIYYEDLNIFISYWKKNPSEVSLFKSKTIFLGSSRGGGLYWLKAEQLYIDKPYIETGLGELNAIHGKYSIWTRYRDAFNENQLNSLVEFLKATGAMSVLKVSHTGLHENPHSRELWKDYFNNRTRDTNTGISEDYSIDGLQKYLAHDSISCSQLVWNALICGESKFAKARYRPNQNYPTREADSQLVHHLKNNAWIPNKQSEFCKPQDMSRDELRNDFPYDDRNGLLTAIGFGENARKRSEEYQTKNKKAQEMGFESAEQAAKFAELAKRGISPDELIAQQKRAELPEESVPNPERRRKGVLERSENAPSKESVTRERSIQPGIGNVVAEAKAYLRTKYTNANREMVCQCCQDEMPFKIGDEYYFEAVQCVKNTAKHHLENRLALCPTCAAMYLHARATDDTELRRLIVEHDALDDAGSVEIPLVLANRQCRLRFVGTHFFDLKTVLAKE